MKWRILIRNKSLNPQSVSVSIENRWIYSICGFNPHRPPVTITRDHHGQRAEETKVPRVDRRKTGFPAATTATFAVPEHLAKYPVQQVLPSILLLLLFLFFSGNYDRLFVHFKFFLISTDVRPLLYTFLPQHSSPCLSFEYIGQ